MGLIEQLEREIIRLQKRLDKNDKKLTPDEKVRLQCIIAHDKGRINCEKKV